MKKSFTIFSFIAIAACIIEGCSNSNLEKKQEQLVSDQQEIGAGTSATQQDTIKKSIPSEADGKIGKTKLEIKYHAPGVKGRTIWGGLVPYDQVWVTGAHKATSLEFNRPIEINGQNIPAGKYALFTIPEREEWTVILNKNWDQHLTDHYNQREDVIRVNVKPEIVERHQERLKYEIKAVSDTEGVITINWEKLLISVPVKTSN